MKGKFNTNLKSIIVSQNSNNLKVSILLIMYLYFFLVLSLVSSELMAEDYSYSLGGIADIGLLNNSSEPPPEILGGADWGNSIRGKISKKIDDITYTAIAMEGFRFGTKQTPSSHAFVKEISLSIASPTWGVIKAGRLENPVYLALGDGVLDPFLWGRNDYPLLDSEGARLTGVSWLSPVLKDHWSVLLEHGKQVKAELDQSFLVANYKTKNVSALVSKTVIGDHHSITAGGSLLYEWGSLIGTVQHRATYSAFSAGFIQSFDNKQGEMEVSYTWLTDHQKQLLVGASHTLDVTGRWAVYSSVGRTLLPNDKATNMMMVGIRWTCLACIAKGQDE